VVLDASMSSISPPFPRRSDTADAQRREWVFRLQGSGLDLRRFARCPLPSSTKTGVPRIETTAADRVYPQCGMERCEIGCERFERGDSIPGRFIRE